MFALPREPTGVTCCPEYTALEEMTTPRSPAPCAGRCGLGTAEPAIRCGAHPRGVEGPGADGVAAQWMPRSRQSLPAQHSLSGRSCCQDTPSASLGCEVLFLVRPKPQRASPNKSQPRESGRGTRNPGVRTCGATKPRKAATLPSLASPSSPPSGESGGWLTQNSAVAQVKAQLNKAHAQMCPRRPARAHARARRPAPALPAGAAPAGTPRRVSAPGSPGSGSVAPQAQLCTERRRGRVSRNAWGAGTEAEVGHSRGAVMGARPRSLGCGTPRCASRGACGGSRPEKKQGVRDKARPSARRALC